MKVYIWGTGVLTAEYLEQGEVNEEDILGFIETQKRRDIFRGKRVYVPEELAERKDYDYILVCVYSCGKEIYDTCRQAGIDTDKLVLADNWEWIDGTSMKNALRNCCRKINKDNIDIKKTFPKLYSLCSEKADIQAGRYIVVSRNGFDLCEKDALILQDAYSKKEYQTDYFRYRTFELMANEIINMGINGNVAELGVFRGTFSKIINEKFKEKKLYLFDTFESFDLEEFQNELKLGRCSDNFLSNFKNTTEDYVLSIMPYPEKCVVKKGLFPGTVAGLDDETFAFVSIDVDFEKSILEGLRYFYPRLSKGGAIFVHDYNNRFLGGVKKAVAIYENEMGDRLMKVPLADEGGTLVIIK